jgi:DNA-binding response OmpR family regulator
MKFPKRILIIDDEPDMVAWLFEVVTMAGYTATGTTVPTTGLVMASEQVPDLIVCDITMPGLSGFHVFQLLKDHRNTAKIPVILMSGEVFAIAPEGVGVLAKPFQAEDLLALIEQQLRAAELAANDLSFRATG